MENGTPVVDVPSRIPKPFVSQYIFMVCSSTEYFFVVAS
jgi:hypothetical protein